MLAGWNNGGPNQVGGALPADAATTSQVHGLITESSNAATARRGVLDAAFSRWLMGFPQSGMTQGWDTCSPGWESWVTVQRILAESFEKPDEIAAADSKDTATR